MKNFKMSIITFAIIATVFAAGFAVSADTTSVEHPVVGYFLGDLIECS